MTPATRFAVQIGPYDSAESLAEYGRRVESLGYSEFYTADHIGPSTAAWTRPDPFVPLMVVAGATTTLGVGTLVLNAGFWNPALLARTAASVDRLTNGRLVLGLGSGYDRSEHDAIGEPILAPGDRVDRLAEVLAVVTGLLHDDTVDIDGRFVSAHLAELGVRPRAIHVPILLGGHGHRMVGLAGRFADIYQFTGLSHTADGSIVATASPAALDDRARWLADAAGDRNDSITRSALVQFTAVGDDVPDHSQIASDFGVDADDLDDCPFFLFGSVDQIVDKIGRMTDRFGITHWVVRDAEGFAPVVGALG